MSRNTEPLQEFIPFARPAIGPEEERAVLKVLRSGWLTTGEVAKRFEQEFGQALSASHALAVNSATSGLHLALEVLGIGEGDWVISSPYTFTATVEVARYLGAHPLFVDIEEDTLNIDTHLVEKAVASSGRNVKCVVPVHVGGHPCDMQALGEICSSRSIPVVEDSAHAFPCETNRGPAGTAGDIGVFSFYATKTITTGEGGMFVTSSDALARKAGVLRLHGIDRDVWGRYQSSRPMTWEYDVVAPGYKYNMPDLNAAVGLEQLRKATAFRARRRQIAAQYTEAFSGVDFIETPPMVAGHSWHLFVVGLKLNQLSISRDEFLAELMNRGIGCSVHFKPLHLMTYYRSTYGLKPQDFPRSLQTYLKSFSLPIYPALCDEDVERVIAAVIEIGKEHYRHHG
jgi:dTDP-4-amino-4,6-dideoxygalactose transaminase